HLQKNVLCQVLFRDPAGQACPDDSNDERIKMFHQLPCGLLVTLAHPLEATDEVKRRGGIFGHAAMERRSYTQFKTTLDRGSYPGAVGPASDDFHGAERPCPEGVESRFSIRRPRVGRSQTDPTDPLDFRPAVPLSPRT